MTPLAKAVERLSHSRDRWRVFSDFIEMAAISISNAVDLNQREKREARYMQIVKGYKPDEVAEFPQMLGQVVMALEEKPRDVLGALFGELELANKWVGQFFTPQDLADMMARMVLDQDVEQIVKDRGFITLQEPAVGGGAMVIAACNALKERGINYQQQCHVTAIDVDDRAVHMAYVQLSLLGVPAVIVHGNTLTLEQHGVWFTPQHIFGLWDWKLRRARGVTPAPAPEAPKIAAPIRGEQLTLI